MHLFLLNVYKKVVYDIYDNIIIQLKIVSSKKIFVASYLVISNFVKLKFNGANFVKTSLYQMQYKGP